MINSSSRKSALLVGKVGKLFKVLSPSVLITFGTMNKFPNESDSKDQDTFLALMLT